jgi:hypothetical protein
MTMLPSAMIMPHDKSMPAVRMTSVWPMAMVPTTMTCCMMSEKFCSDRKRSFCVAKEQAGQHQGNEGPQRAHGGQFRVRISWR